MTKTPRLAAYLLTNVAKIPHFKRGGERRAAHKAGILVQLTGCGLCCTYQPGDVNRFPSCKRARGLQIESHFPSLGKLECLTLKSKSIPESP